MDSPAYKTEAFPFVISAPSGTGKTTILRLLMERDRGLRHVVSTTTRPARAGEVEGLDYYFVDDDTFNDMIAGGLFVEWAEVFGDRYGTSRAALESVLNDGYMPVLDLDVQGAARLRRAYPGCATVFIAPPSLEKLQQRLEKRHTESGDGIDLRLRIAREEMKHIPEYDYLVINEHLDETVNLVAAILAAEKGRLKRIKSDELKKWTAL